MSMAESPLLRMQGITAAYGRTRVLWGIDLTVEPGGAVALLGPNGAGKTSLLRVAAGLLAAESGDVVLAGRDVTKAQPHIRTRHGLCLVPEGRGIFPNLTVRENLLLQVPPWEKNRDFQPALDAFPILSQRLGQKAGSMSGGQQQMLALARCFLARPSIVLLDEVSMGLAPRVIDEIFEAFDNLRQDGVALLLVEQYVARALKLADHVFLLNRGRVSFSGRPDELANEDIALRYLGT
jgi:branched-chain amino acid transport system ATP-binding protein